MNIFIRPYGASTSALYLSRLLCGKRIKNYNSNYRYRPHHIVINWGSGRPFQGQIRFNQPAAVAQACNKLTTFEVLKNANIPTCEWTRSKAIAEQWLNNNSIVYARTTAHGHAGEGIDVYTNSQQEILNRYQFFTKRFNTKREFRVHVINGEAVQVQEKKRRNNATNLNEFIRSHRNNWVFCINNLSPIPDQVNSTAIRAVAALGLDFGGVDIAINSLGDVCVFEVNTAPGIEGSTLQIYANKFKELINNEAD